MKILQVMAGASTGGAETAYVDMCIALKDAGAHVVAVTRKNKLRVTNLQNAGIQTYTLPFGGALDFYTTLQLRRLITAEKPDIVQCWMSRAAQKTPASPVGGHKFKKVCRLGGYYALKYFKGADHFTTITPMIRDWLIAEGVPAQNVTHINNFAEVDAAQAPINRAHLQTPDDAFVYLSLARLHTSKALDTLLEALAKAPGLYLWLAGEGPDREKLENLAAKLNITNRVRFLGWRADRGPLLAACDAVVFPSRYEPFGTVFVQAWAAQKPVIVSNADGPRQFVAHEKDALVFNIDDVDALANHLKNLAQNKDLQKNLVAQGHHHYQTAFTKEAAVKSYLDLYAQLLSGIK